MRYNYLNHKTFIKLFATTAICLFGTVFCHAQDKAYAVAVVKKLASPAFKGRGYEENGAKIASEFIAAEYKRAGLLPLNKGSYFQPYKLSANIFPGVVSVQLDGVTLTTAADYLISASSPSVNGTFKVIPVSRSQVNTEQALSSLLNGAGDAFLLLDNRPDSKETAEETAAINKHVAQLKNDKSLIFKGLLIYTEDKLTWTSLTYQSVRPVVTINKKDFNPKTVKSVKIRVDAKLLPDYETRNVAGMVKGTVNPDSLLVVTAHFDHLGMMGKKVYFPGANDNASGTAMLLSMVKYYGSHPPKYSMVFIAFSGEEIGMLGSKAFVEDPLIDLKKIKFLTNFDMAGTGEEGIRVVNGTIFKPQFDRLVQLNDQYKLVPKVDIRGESCNSDHCRFYERGVPSFFIYTQGGIRAYHDIYDRAETLPFTEFEHYFQLMVKFFDGL
jgi:aminopeptidase YwaD